MEIVLTCQFDRACPVHMTTSKCPQSLRVMLSIL
jgi:hypothetical protein